MGGRGEKSEFEQILQGTAVVLPGASVEEQGRPAVHRASQGVSDTATTGGPGDGDGDDPHRQAPALPAHPGGARLPFCQGGPVLSHVFQLLLYQADRQEE